MSKDYFHFKKFTIKHAISTMKVGTDGVLLGAWAQVENGNRILDIGTGCGLIALMLAQRNSKALIDAIDIDPESCEEATYNVQQSPWSNRVTIFQTSLQPFRETCSNQYDHIVSNPPFFNAGSKPQKRERQKARHTATLKHTDLLSAATDLLGTHGKLSIILPVSEGQQCIARAADYKLFLTRRLTFFSKKINPAERLLLQFERQPNHLVVDKLVHYTDKGNWTEDYKLLTKDFHKITDTHKIK